MSKQSLSGAKVIIECLKREGVEVIFGYPGGAVIPIFDAILDSPIKLVLVRHEQGATHMADGYARYTGKAGVALVTSGPAATNAITGLYTALMDSVPLIVLSGQTITPNLGKDAFQECDTSGITFAATKHSYLVKDANDLPRILKEAFHIATTGRPGPVLIDLPKDVTSALCTAPFVDSVDLPGYKIPGKGDSTQVEKAAQLLAQSKRPVILAGHGVLISGAHKQLREFAEKLNAPVTNTLLGLGSFPGMHTLSLGMLGMHGTAYSNKALVDCDLVMSIGSRWDDRITGRLDAFCPHAKKIHVDIDASEEGKVVRPDVFVHGDAKLVLEQIIPLISRLDTADWLKTIEGWKKKFPLQYSKQGGLKMQHVFAELHRLTKSRAVVSTDVGQHQMWAAQFFPCEYPNQWLSSGGAGTMGFGFPAAIGAAFAKPDMPVVAIAGDGGFQMTQAELATAQIHKLPIKILVMDNKYLGMVRQWQDMFYEKRYSGVDLEGNPDFVKLAEAFGVKALRLRRQADTARILQQALDYNEGPILVHCECEKEDNVYPMIPPGAPISGMIVEPPKHKLEKPTGST